jgi:hypothetical protein
MFITALTQTRHLSSFWAISIQPTHSFLILIHFNIILLCEPKSYRFSLMCPHQNPVYSSPLPQTYSTPRHLTLIDLITQIIWRGEHNTKLIIMQYLPFLRPLVSLDPNFFLSALFSKTISLCSSINARDEISHPHTTNTGELIIVWLYSRY